MIINNQVRLFSTYLFLGAALLMTSCDKDSEALLEEEGISIADLSGKWSITNEVNVVTNAAGATVDTENESYANNMLTIEFKDDETFLFIAVEDAEWASAGFTLDEIENTVELDFVDEVTLLSIVNINATSAEFKIVEEEEENGEIFTSTTTMSLTKNTGSEPGIDEADLKTRWSMGSHNVYVNGQLITSDIMEEQWMETVATINNYRYTFDLTSSAEVLSVNNYMTGTYDEGTLVVLDRSNYVVELEGFDEAFLFHITANSGTTGLSVVHYQETDDADIKIEQDWTSDFTTPSLTAALLDGAWEVMAKSEGREINGQTAESEGEGPAVGNVINFFANGSGNFGQDQFTFEFIDDNNIALTSTGETEYTLIHFETYNGTNEITIWNLDSGWDLDYTSFEQEWIELDLVKQE